MKRLLAPLLGLALAGPLAAADFAPIYRVLTHPRCLNCHVAGSQPRQGNERRLHDFRVVRGPDNLGAAAMRCVACHRDANNAGIPGAPHWGLAPLGMAWEGLAPPQLCARLKDKQLNGGRDLPALVRHMEADALVGWAWQPGAGREPPPLPKDEFVRLLRAWAAEGGACPAP